MLKTKTKVLKISIFAYILNFQVYLWFISSLFIYGLFMVS